jgi:hypothetical protein
VGINVEPLGDGLIRLFPDGFRLLFAPAAALPAPVLRPPFVLPAEDPAVVPFMVDPVLVPLVAGPTAPELPPAEMLPLWASANVLVSVSAKARPMLVSLMAYILPWVGGKPVAPRYVPDASIVIGCSHISTSA